jgi:5-methyltetrahydrofolate--homocysteine methyltransferase
MNDIITRLAYCVERGKVNITSNYPPDLKGEEGAEELAKKAVEMGLPPSEILNQGLILGMERIGVKFRDNKVFVPDVLIAAKAMNAGMKHIKPFFLSNEIKYRGKILLGTVAGDLHDIGKNIVGMIMQGGGWEVIDLGVDCSARKFADAVKIHKPYAAGLSALLTTTMLNMDGIIKEIRNADPGVKILVGGAPLSNEFAVQAGADNYSPDPQAAIEYLNNIGI